MQFAEPGRTGCSVPDILQPVHMPVARVYGEEQWHESLACAKDPCHTNRTGPEALGDRREADR